MPTPTSSPGDSTAETAPQIFRPGPRPATASEVQHGTRKDLWVSPETAMKILERDPALARELLGAAAADLGDAASLAALTRSAFGPFETKRLFNRLYAASRVGLDTSIETVADLSALAALTVAAGQPNSRFARVTSKGQLWMAQSAGTGLARWVPAVATILITLDSMGYLKFEPWYKKAWQAYGFGGYMGYLTDYEGEAYPGMLLGGGAALNNQPAGEGSPSDYAVWPNGRWVDLDASGEYIQFGSLAPGRETQIIKAIYYRESGAGAIRIRSRSLGGEWTDEVGYDNFSVAGTAGNQFITINKGSRAAREYRIEWVSGAVKICLAGALNESGVQFVELNYGGITLTDWNRWPVASATTVLGDLNPCLITHEAKEVAASPYPTDLVNFEALLTAAGVGTDPEDTTQGTTDVLYIGTTPTNNGVENNAQLNVVARAHAAAYGRAFIDCLTAGLPWEATNVAFGGNIDGTHLYGAAQSYFADFVARQLRLFGGVLETRSPSMSLPRALQDLILIDQPLAATLGLNAHRVKQMRGGVVSSGSNFAFAATPTIGTGDFTLYVWHFVPAIGSGARDFLGLAASNITTNVASALSCSVDQGTDSFLLELRNAANNGTRRISISQYFENFSGQLVMLCIRRTSGRLTMSINGNPLGLNYEYRASATGLGYPGYTESTAGTNPPAFSATIDATALQIFGGTTTRWASPVHEAALYTVAHTDAQVRAYRMTGSPPAGAAGLWQFDENTGRTSYDLSGNSRNMTTTTTSAQVEDLWVRRALVPRPTVTNYTSSQTLTALQAGGIFTNTGATAIVPLTLPTALAAGGLVYEFTVLDADGIRVVAASGDTIRVGASVSAAAGNVASTTIGDTIRLVCLNDTEWVAMPASGTWTVT